MKITSLKAVYPRYQHVPPSWRTHLWQIVVRVETDAGVVGFGYGGGGVAAVENRQPAYGPSLRSACGSTPRAILPPYGTVSTRLPHRTAARASPSWR